MTSSSSTASPNGGARVELDDVGVRYASARFPAVDGVDQEVFGAPAASMWDASGASRAPVGVRVTTGELDLLPDAGMLTGPATQFPVSIDPFVAWTGVQQAWTKTDACFPNQTYWNGANDTDPNRFGAVKVGRAPMGYGDPCDGTTWRSLFRMDTSRVAHRTVHSAKFNVFETYAPACNAEPPVVSTSSTITTRAPGGKTPSMRS